MKERVRTLDGIRGVAILLVLAGHIVANYRELSPGLRHWLEAFANPGAGVRLFFVLSGYLITDLLMEEQIATGTISLRRFYWRRILRIFPVFYSYLIVIALINIWWPIGITPKAWVAAATFTWNYSFLWVPIARDGYWNLGHFWTLALEEQFYLLWPAALLVCGRRRALFLAMGLILWCPLARVASYFLFPIQRGYIGMMLHTSVDSLMIGCTAALLLQSDKACALMRAASVKFAGIAALWLFAFSPFIGTMLHGFPVACGFTLDGIAAAWLIAWAHHTTCLPARVWLGRGMLPAIGLISYSLYIWQQIFLSPTGGLSSGHALLPLIGAVATAGVSYHLIESPALKLKSKWSGFISSTSCTR